MRGVLLLLFAPSPFSAFSPVEMLIEHAPSIAASASKIARPAMRRLALDPPEANLGFGTTPSTPRSAQSLERISMWAAGESNPGPSD
jgi:hypothetical protein